MKIEAQSLEGVLSGIVLEVPFFQRPYVWKKENWEELLNDLLGTGASHFLGSIILKEQDNGASKLKKYLIVDGQQRLTTLSILMKALYDCMENERSNIFDSITRILFYKELPSDSNHKIILNHSHNDNSQFKEVIGVVKDREILSSIIEELDGINIEDDTQKSLIKKSYKYFYNKLSKLYKENSEEVVSFCNKLLNSSEILAVIFLDKNDSEQKIFDSINTSGIRLSATDTIKNALYQKLIDLSNSKENIISYYKNTWENTFEKDDETIEYWCSEKVSGNLKLQNSELLLRYFAVIKGLYNPNNNKTSQLADIYKNYITDKNEDIIKKLIQEIIEYANIYRERFSKFDESTGYKFDNIERRLFGILSMNKITVFTPYILFLLKTYSKDSSALDDRFRYLEKLIVKKIIIGGVQKDANKQILEFISDTDGYAIKRCCNEITPEMIRNGLKTKVSVNTAKILLFWIELYRRYKDKKYSDQSLTYKFQLEHIMPIKWEEHWSDVPYDDNPRHKCNNQILRQNRVEKITSLGNMTLLTAKLNIAISNDNFKNKIEKGIKTYDGLSITKVDIIENVYDEGREWNEAEITKRERKLADEIIEIWG